MITEQDLQEAIAECQGQRNPNASTCIKLAAFLTIKDALYGKEKEQPEQAPVYSFASEPEPRYPIIDYDGDSEFAQEIDGRRQDEVLPVIDELMDVIKATNPRLYAGVIRQLND